MTLHVQQDSILYLNIVRFEVRKEVTTVFLDVTPRSVVEVY